MSCIFLYTYILQAQQSIGNDRVHVSCEQYCMQCKIVFEITFHPEFFSFMVLNYSCQLLVVQYKFGECCKYVTQDSLRYVALLQQTSDCMVKSLGLKEVQAISRHVLQIVYNHSLRTFPGKVPCQQQANTVLQCNGIEL